MMLSSSLAMAMARLVLLFFSIFNKRWRVGNCDGFGVVAVLVTYCLEVLSKIFL